MANPTSIAFAALAAFVFCSTLQGCGDSNSENGTDWSSTKKFAEEVVRNAQKEAKAPHGSSTDEALAGDIKELQKLIQEGDEVDKYLSDASESLAAVNHALAQQAGGLGKGVDHAAAGEKAAKNLQKEYDKAKTKADQVFLEVKKRAVKLDDFIKEITSESSELSSDVDADKKAFEDVEHDAKKVKKEIAKEIVEEGEEGESGGEGEEGEEGESGTGEKFTLEGGQIEPTKQHMSSPMLFVGAASLSLLVLSGSVLAARRMRREQTLHRSMYRELELCEPDICEHTLQE